MADWFKKYISSASPPLYVFLLLEGLAWAIWNPLVAEDRGFKHQLATLKFFEIHIRNYFETYDEYKWVGVKFRAEKPQSLLSFW